MFIDVTIDSVQNFTLPSLVKTLPYAYIVLNLSIFDINKVLSWYTSLHQYLEQNQYMFNLIKERIKYLHVNYSLYNKVGTRYALHRYTTLIGWVFNLNKVACDMFMASDIILSSEFLYYIKLLQRKEDIEYCKQLLIQTICNRPFSWLTFSLLMQYYEDINPDNEIKQIMENQIRAFLTPIRILTNGDINMLIKYAIKFGRNKTIEDFLLRTKGHLCFKLRWNYYLYVYQNEELLQLSDEELEKLLTYNSHLIREMPKSVLSKILYKNGKLRPIAIEALY